MCFKQEQVIVVLLCCVKEATMRSGRGCAARRVVVRQEGVVGRGRPASSCSARRPRAPAPPIKWLMLHGDGARAAVSCCMMSDHDHVICN